MYCMQLTHGWMLQAAGIFILLRCLLAKQQAFAKQFKAYLLLLDLVGKVREFCNWGAAALSVYLK